MSNPSADDTVSIRLGCVALGHTGHHTFTNISLHLYGKALEGVQ